MLELFHKIDLLNKDVRNLRGENEQLQHQVEKLKQTQKNGFLNVDDQIDKLSKQIQAAARAQATTPPQAKKPATPPTPQKPRAKLLGKAEVVDVPKRKIRAATQIEKADYNKAYALLKNSSSAATQAFSAYIKKHPESPLSANAQYWIGEIMYSRKNYKGAVDEFVKVLQNYKNSEKAPDAAIKLGFSFYELKNWVYARRALEDVTRYFPKTRAAELAKQRIAKMKATGHY